VLQEQNSQNSSYSGGQVERAAAARGSAGRVYCSPHGLGSVAELAGFLRRSTCTLASERVAATNDSHLEPRVKEGGKTARPALVLALHATMRRRRAGGQSGGSFSGPQRGVTGGWRALQCGCSVLAVRPTQPSSTA